VIVNNAVKIYPNPANETVTVEAVAKNNYTVIITDVLGRDVYNGTFTRQLQIPVNNWQAGMYYVQVVSESGFKITQKLLVE
jgi:hypothetical protein